MTLRHYLFAAFLACLLLTPWTSTVLAEPANVYPIEITVQSLDPVGQALAEQTIAQFKKDKSFRVVVGSSDPRIVLHLSTMGTDANGVKIAAYSEAITFDLPGENYQTFAGCTVGICNLKEVPDDAKAIVYNVTKLVQNYPTLSDQVKLIK